MNKRHFIYSLPMILLLIVVITGWFATHYLGYQARREIISESQASVLTLSTYVSSIFTTIEGAVKSLSGAVYIAPALTSKRSQDIENANSALDRYNSALNASVSYLMDANGMTIVSSNRKDPDSFVGTSYRFRPYFQEAAKGQPYHYFALGITSGKRGFYASYPVQNRPGKVLGVVTMKKDLDDMGIFFRKYPFCFLISPEGIIFLSSKPEMVRKSFWPLDKTTQEKLIASQQFGNKPFEAVTQKEMVDGTEVTFKGKNYFVSRKVIDSGGWSIVLLTSTDRIWIYKLTGILATIFVCFLIIIFTAIIYLTERSHEAIRQSEESKCQLLDAVGDGIFVVDAKGRVTFVNPAALHMLEYVEEEMLGQMVHALIHHSHKDGSNYPVEDCPMYASFTRAVDSHVEDEVLWRKDGSSFPVDYFSTPIIRDGKVEGVVVTFRDITKRKQAEDSLRESEERYRVLVENASDIIFRTDVNGNFTFVNPAMIHISGYEKEELIGEQYTILIRPDMRDNALKFFGRQMVKGLQNTYSEYPIITKDGQNLWFGQNTQLIVNDGKVTGFQVVSRDITDRKRMEEKLRFEEKRFRAFVEHASDMIVLVNPEGVILYVNPAIESILGYKPEERIGANGGEIVHPDDVKALVDVFTTLSRDTSSPVINGELRLRHKDGSWRTLEATGSNLVNNNVVESIIINYRDITERKKAEDGLRKSEEKFKQLAEVFPETIFEANMKGDVTYANEHGLKQFGLTQEDIVSGINIFDLVSPLDRNLAMERIQTRIKDNDNSDKRYLEYKAVKKDGSTFYAMALSVPIMVDGEPVGIRGFILDITERKQAENMLYESEERYRLIAENTADTISVFDLNLKPTYISPSILKLRGYPVQEAMTQTLDQMLTPDSLQQARKHFADQMALELSGTADLTRTILMELEEYCKDGSTILVELAASFLRDKNLKPTGILTVTRDITERKKAEEQIQYLATHDLLTDLPSLRFAKDRLSVALNMARRYKKAVAVMFIDLDGFKDVNDTLGHDTGDYVLQQVAKRLLSCVRETDTVTRIGGDEFLIIATEINAPENVAQIAEKVIHLVSQPIIFNGRQSVVTASIGIALFPDDGQDMDQLIKKADEAMYSVKKAGKNGFRFINPKVN